MKRNFLPPLGSLEFAVVMNADLKYRYVQPVNAKAWAIGRKLQNGRIKVRRIVWGRLLAREEKWTGEIITPVRILVRSPQQTTNRERASKAEQANVKERANNEQKTQPPRARHEKGAHHEPRAGQMRQSTHIP